MRSSMKEERLKKCMLMTYERETLDSLDLERTVTQ